MKVRCVRNFQVSRQCFIKSDATHALAIKLIQTVSPGETIIELFGPCPDSFVLVLHDLMPQGKTGQESTHDTSHIQQ